MKRILIIKTGDTLPGLVSKHGDFEQWVLAGMQVKPENAFIVDVVRGDSFPDFHEISGAAITGSHSMVTEHLDWMEFTASWARDAITQGLPVLGICFGHQLLAYAFGGDVGDNPNGLEFGTVKIEINQAGRQNDLFHDFPSTIEVQVSHTQSVLRLPENAVLLASSAMDPHQAFVVEDMAWGLQFHPEFNADIAKGYIEHMRRAIRQKNGDPDELIKGCKETPFGSQILKRYADIVREKAANSVKT